MTEVKLCFRDADCLCAMLVEYRFSVSLNRELK